MKPFAMVSGVMAVAAFVREAAAQATPPVLTPVPAPSAAASGDNSGILMALALMGGLRLLVGIGVKIWDAPLRKQDFFGLAITPTVHAGLRRSAPMRIEVTGQAPSAALRIVRDEATRMGCDFEIDDRIELRSAGARRAA